MKLICRLLLLVLMVSCAPVLEIEALADRHDGVYFSQPVIIETE